MAEDKGEDIAPPFHGFIATTYDALLVFEGARRGIIPRVTRRLNDTERNMVQSGSVFVYDEQESGIKRWTDGHSWSPSRILANFLVYRETIKPSDGKDGKDEDGLRKEPSSAPGTRPGSSHREARPATANSSPGTGSPSATESYAESSRMALEAAQRPLVHGQMRPRSAAEAGGCRLENGLFIDRHLERKLVGSLTNSYLFQPGGLVKKTMTLTINGFHQHVVSYYTLEDAVAGRLRRPSTIPEFASLEISPEYLNVANFRYPPSIELGQDGVPRYHGEPDDRPNSPATRVPQGYASDMYESYGQHAPPIDLHHQPRLRSVTVPAINTTFAQPPPSYPMPPNSSQGYYDPQGVHGLSPASRQGGPMRSGAGSRRYDPYSNPRMSQSGLPTPMSESGHVRRQSQPPPSSTEGASYYQGSEYNYQPPSTAPGAFAYYSPASAAPPPQQPPLASPIVSPSYGSTPYGSWHQAPGGVRHIASGLGSTGDPPSSSGSIDSAPGSSGHVMGPDGWAMPAGAPHPPPPVWDNHPPPLQQSSYVMPPQDGWQAGLA